ncbi:unnamed protein product [Symbiodinium microadriaticum]|nr:unnamed protein product [Symbiodinium microadriaticum]
MPSSSTYAPFYLAATEPPRPYTRGSLFKYDPSTSFWNFCAAGNWAARFYKHAIVVVKQLQDELESSFSRAVAEMDVAASKVLTDCEADKHCDMASAEQQVRVMLTDFTHSKGDHTVESWRELLPRLITQFHDGYSAEDLDAKDIKMRRLFYPKWWLDAVGFFNSTPNRDPKAIMFAPNPAAPVSTEGELAYTHASYMTGIVAAALLASAASVVIGFVLGRRLIADNTRNQYAVINDLL